MGKITILRKGKYFYRIFELVFTGALFIRLFKISQNSKYESFGKLSRSVYKVGDPSTDREIFKAPHSIYELEKDSDEYKFFIRANDLLDLKLPNLIQEIKEPHLILNYDHPFIQVPYLSIHTTEGAFYIEGYSYFYIFIKNWKAPFETIGTSKIEALERSFKDFSEKFIPGNFIKVQSNITPTNLIKALNE